MHADEVDTDPALVGRLLAEQFPRWADLPIEPVLPMGTDNALYRLGDDMVARLARTDRTTHFTVVCNRDFDGVVDGCAAPGPKRARTWINARIRSLYRGLFDIGHCHSVEVYDGEALVGGLYGVSLGRAYFGESMFHAARDASKIALVHLVARLKAGGYRLLDTQFLTDHLKLFGATEIPRARYHRVLGAALKDEADARAFTGVLSGADALRLAGA